jgi:hypothetical protein
MLLSPLIVPQWACRREETYVTRFSCQEGNKYFLKKKSAQKRALFKAGENISYLR